MPLLNKAVIVTMLSASVAGCFSLMTSLRWALYRCELTSLLSRWSHARRHRQHRRRLVARQPSLDSVSRRCSSGEGSAASDNKNEETAADRGGERASTRRQRVCGRPIADADAGVSVTVAATAEESGRRARLAS